MFSRDFGGAELYTKEELLAIPMRTLNYITMTDEDIQAAQYLPYVKRLDDNVFINQSIYMRNATETEPLFDYILRQLRGQRMGIEGRAEDVMTYGLRSRDNFSEKIPTFIMAQEYMKYKNETQAQLFSVELNSAKIFADLLDLFHITSKFS